MVGRHIGDEKETRGERRETNKIQKVDIGAIKHCPWDKSDT